MDTYSDEYGEYQIVYLPMLKGGQPRPMKVYLKPMKHIVKDYNPNPRGWYKSKHESDRVRPRPCYTEAVLTVPYGGYCPVGCKVCYVDNGTRGYRSTGLPTVSPDYPEHMRKQISKMMIAPAFYISSFTEPFQKLEDEYKIVRRLTEVLVDEGLPLFYLSRKLPPDWAVEALQQNPYSYMQWSINTSKTSIYKKLSPGSYTIEEVMGKMRELANKDIYISIQCNPILPGIVDLEDMIDLIHMISENGGDHMIFKFVRENYTQKAMIMERLRKSRVEGVDEFSSLLNQNIGGMVTIQQDMRIDWLNVLLEETRKAHITMSTCYEYYEDGHAGTNLAPYFTTADQCHGRGVPMFFRPAPGEEFQPLAGCYRKGCLYCEEYGTKVCNNATLLQAKALKFSDYKRIVIDSDDRNWELEDSCKVDRAANPGFMTDAELWGWETG